MTAPVDRPARPAREERYNDWAKRTNAIAEIVTKHLGYTILSKRYGIADDVIALFAAELDSLRAELLASRQDADRLRAERDKASPIILRVGAEIARMGWLGDDELSDASHDRILVHVRSLKGAFDILNVSTAEEQAARQSARHAALVAGRETS